MKRIGPLLVIVLASLLAPADPWTGSTWLRAAAILLVAVPCYFAGLAHGREPREPAGAARLPRRRWLQFSLRTLLLLTALLAVYLSLYCERARRQKEAVKALRVLDCSVVYGSDLDGSLPASLRPWSEHGGIRFHFTSPERRWSWLCERLGADFFDRVVLVRVQATKVETAIPFLKRLPHLQEVFIEVGNAFDVVDASERLRRELPHVEVQFCGLQPFVL